MSCFRNCNKSEKQHLLPPSRSQGGLANPIRDGVHRTEGLGCCTPSFSDTVSARARSCGQPAALRQLRGGGLGWGRQPDVRAVRSFKRVLHDPQPAPPQADGSRAGCVQAPARGDRAGELRQCSHNHPAPSPSFLARCTAAMGSAIPCWARPSPAPAPPKPHLASILLPKPVVCCSKPP